MAPQALFNPFRVNKSTQQPADCVFDSVSGLQKRITIFLCPDETVHFEADRPVLLNGPLVHAILNAFGPDDAEGIAKVDP